MKPSKRILAITKEPWEACTRYRVHQYRSSFAQAGVELQSIPWPRWPKERQTLLASLKQWDAIVVQRLLPGRAWIRQIRRRSKRLVFDFDDAILFRDSARGVPLPTADRWFHFRAMVRRCDAITAGNGYLAALATRFADHSKIFVAPTTLDLNRYPRRICRKSGTALGWIGSRSTLPYLERLQSPLSELTRQRSDLRLRVIVDRPPRIGCGNLEWRMWSSETEISDLLGVDIGLAPLPDDRWTRGKCALRLLQYLAAGIPAIASPVGSQAEIIKAGAAAPAAKLQDWAPAVLAMLEQPVLAARRAEIGWALVQQQFNAAAHAPRLAGIWLGAAG